MNTDADRGRSVRLAYVRVQDGLHGATMGPRGLNLPYARDNEFGNARNTSHWTVNSVVGDHAYGRFNENADGSLKGKVVIIADPDEMPTPAGLGQVDTWFRFDVTVAADGALQRGLTVGRRAVVVAPDDVAVPPGVEVVRYRGGIAERDSAVEGVLRSRSIELEQAGMWGWQGRGNSEHWAEATARTLYPGDSASIHVGSHAGSIDERIESQSTQINALLKAFETERLYVRDDGVEVLTSDVIRERLAGQRADIESLIASLPEAERIRTGQFYTAQLAALDEVAGKTRAIEHAWAMEAARAQNSSVGDPQRSEPPPLPPPLPWLASTATVLPPPLPGSAFAAMAPPPLPSVDNAQPGTRSPMKLIPFGGDSVVAREPYEKIDEEVYTSIPALNDMARSSMALSTKLTLDARAALFGTDRNASPRLRQVAVELGIERRFAMEGATPDPEYLNGQAKTNRQQYETADNDLWLSPGGPGA